MKIGVYFTPRKDQGGVYSYTVEILEVLHQIPENQYIVFTTSPDIPDKYKKLSNFKVINVNSGSRNLIVKGRNFILGSVSIAAGLVIKFLNNLKLFNLLTPFYKFSNRSYIRLLQKVKPDLMIYPTSSYLSFLTKIPALVTVHDLQHRLNPQFKEVSAGGMWEYREYGFINIARNAFRVFVDSEVGKKQMIKFYPASKGKIVVLPYLAPDYLNSRISITTAKRVIKKLNLPEKYIYYPAKFWPHKNHANLIKSLAVLNKEGLKVNLVLSGSKNADFSSFNDVEKLTKDLDLKSQIQYLGYLSDLELSAVYKLATALVMPTFFGPTNIPVLEAWTMGIPVLYSDIEGCREQLGNAGLLINPKDHKDIANKIKKVYKSPALRKSLVAKGKIRVGKWTRLDFTNTIKATIKEFKNNYDSSKSN